MLSRKRFFCRIILYSQVYASLETFKNNSEWNAHDDVINQWDNGNVGNYWDDYTGVDDDGDGIGDIPYNIPDEDGGSNNEDRYPLMNQFNI